jgi:hypothetical protein
MRLDNDFVGLLIPIMGRGLIASKHRWGTGFRSSARYAIGILVF